MLSEKLVGDRRVTVCGPGVSIFVDILVESTNTVFVKSTNISKNILLTNTVIVNSTNNISTNIETPVLFRRVTVRLWRRSERN